MGLFIRKAVRSAVNKSRLSTSYLLTAACFLLIACNVAVFLFFPRIAAPLAIILSNAITVLLMLVSIQPINRLIQNEFNEKAKELLEKQEAQQELQERVSFLENRNRELESRIDTWAQTASVPTNVNFTFKLETMTFDKKGYIVKEEPLERFLDDLAHPGDKKVLYIGKYYIREREADAVLEGEIDSLCEHYTEVFRRNLTERFPGIAFCDHIEDSSATWYSLKEHIQDERIYPIASNMFLMADVLSGYISASPQKSLSEQNPS